MEIPLFFGASPDLFEKARALRRSETEAEYDLWQKLRNRKQIGLKFRRQHPLNQFVADFYCHEIKLVVELDGGIHNESTQQERDEGRTEMLRQQGITVVRFSNEDILYDLQKSLKKIKDVASGIKKQLSEPAR
ncbi:MAG: endonuclease domain-containing protein [Bacteroidetes bacterium]|nr:endonuclease domain-containing protein [Bacteroidota bacterium]